MLALLSKFESEFAAQPAAILSEINEAIGHQTTALGLHGYSLQFFDRNVVDPDSKLTVASESMRSWPDIMASCVFSKLLLNHCRTSILPVLWWDTSFDIRSPNAEGAAFRDLMQACAERGIRGGISIPTHGAGRYWSILNVSSSKPLDHCRDLLERAAPTLHLLASQSLAAFAATRTESNLLGRLTPREIECVVWCSRGKTSWEIAQILGITERTVVFHMQNTTRKLGVSSRTEAVAQLLSQLHLSDVDQIPAR